MDIRVMRDTDQPQVHDLLQKCEQLKIDEAKELVQKGQRFVAYADGKVVGFSRLSSGSAGSYSYWAFVDPVCRRQGVGSALWQRLLSEIPPEAAQVSCSCLDSQKETLAFLRKLGFEPWFGLELMHYSGPTFLDPQLSVRPYEDRDYLDHLRLINEGFYPMRQANDIKPYQIYPSEAHNDEQVRQRVLNAEHEELMFFDGQQLVGLAELVEGEIDTVTVAEELRGKGYGRQIMAYCINLLLSRGYDPVTLHVVSWNSATRNLYESMGFRFIEKRQMMRRRWGA